MYKKIFSLFSIIFVSAAFSMVSAQMADVGISEGRAGGEVVSISDSKIVVQTKDGAIESTLSAATVFKKVSPENVKNIMASSLTELSTGDKVLISGAVAADKKSMVARTVYLMTKTDIAQRHTAEAEQWRTRGISGRVVSVSPELKQITISVARGMAATNVVVTAKQNAKVLRFPQGSYNYNDAKAGAIDEIKPQDEFRAYGDRSEDGTTFAAEGILSGTSAQTMIGTVKSVDAAKNEVVITENTSKKDITVSIGASTLYLKKYPAEQVMRFAGMQGGGAGGPAPAGQGPRPAGTQAGPGPQGQGTPGAGGPGPGGPGMGGGRGGGGGINEIVERAPSITLADLTAGEMIAVVSATKSGDTDRVNAIKLVSNVEPVVKMMQTANAAGGQRGGQGGVNGNFTIPGLDGFGGP